MCTYMLYCITCMQQVCMPLCINSWVNLEGIQGEHHQLWSLPVNTIHLISNLLSSLLSFDLSVTRGFVRICKASTGYSCMYAGAKIENNRDTDRNIETQIFYVENPKGKNHGGPQTPRKQITMMRGSTIRDSETTTLSSSSSSDSYKVTHSFSLSLLLSQVTEATTTLTTLLQFALVAYILI